MSKIIYNIKPFGTIEELTLSTFDFVVGDIIDLQGYYTAGDGAHHKRKIESADDGSGVQLANGLWANIVHNGEVNVSWFGAKGDGVTDDSISFEKACNTANTVSSKFEKLFFKKAVVIKKETDLKLVGTIKTESEYVFGEGYWTGGHSKALTIECKNLTFDILEVVPPRNFEKKWRLKDEKLVKWSSGIYIKADKVNGDELITKECFGYGALFDNVSEINLLRYKGLNVGTSFGIENKFDACGDAFYIKNFKDNCSVNIKEMVMIGNRDVYISEEDEVANRNISRIGLTTEFAKDSTIYINIGKLKSRNFQRTFHSENVKKTIIDIKECDISETPLLLLTEFDAEKPELKINSGEITITKHKPFVIAGLGRAKVEIKNTKIKILFSTSNNGPIELKLKNCELEAVNVNNFTVNTNLYFEDCDLNLTGSNDFYGCTGVFKNCNMTGFTSKKISVIGGFSDTQLKSKLTAIDLKGVKVYPDSSSQGSIFFEKNIELPKQRLHFIKTLSTKDKFTLNSALDDILKPDNIYLVTVVCSDGNNSQRVPGKGTNVSCYSFSYICGNVEKTNLISRNNSGGLELVFDEDKMIQATRWTTVLDIYAEEISRKELSELTNITAKLDTPYYATKMQKLGIYDDFISYMDDQHEYKKQQRELEEKSQEAFDSRENQAQSYEDWLSTQPQLMPFAEPQPSQALLDFKKKYLG